MSNNMLGPSLRDLRGPMNTLWDRLCGPEAKLWLERLKHFNRGEDPFSAYLPGTIELFLHPEQKKGGHGIAGHLLKKYLEKTGQIELALSLKDDVVREWIARPETYPKACKEEMMTLLLWGSVKVKREYGLRRGFSSVAGLSWDDDRVHVGWYGLYEVTWGGGAPAVLWKKCINTV